MKFPVYSVRDLKVGFGFPYVSQSDPYAVRDFKRQLLQSEIMSFCPADYQLFKIGSFDTDKGSIESILPELIFDGGEYNALA